MITKLKLPPSDSEIDQLLARQYRDTSNEFEVRWVNLKRDLRQRPARRNPVFGLSSLARWLGFLGAMAALVFIVQTFRQPALLPTTDLVVSPQLAELMTMDEVLGQALPLLDEENRLALLNLSASN